MASKAIISGDSHVIEPAELWSKPLPGKNVAILLVNTGNAPQNVSLPVTDVPGRPQGGKRGNELNLERNSRRSKWTVGRFVVKTRPSTDYF